MTIAETLGDALERHYVSHGLPRDGGENEPWFRVHIGAIVLRLPNPPARRRAVFFHDVNHVLTGYNTVFSDGEMAIAAFEVGSGCGPFAMAWYINLTMFGLGLFVCPRTVRHAFIRGSGAASMYHCKDERRALVAASVAELRERLHLDRSPGGTRLRASLRFCAWALAAVVTMVAPFAVVAALLKGLVT
jgi:hypothetical protein